VSDDPRERPADPAGTKPKHDPRSLLPSITTTVPDVGRRPAPSPAPRAEEPAAEAPTVRHSRFAPRFSFLLGVLVALALAAIGGLVAVTQDDGVRELTTAGGWSSWRPAQKGAAGAAEVAAHVGPRYKDTKGVQYVDVRARGMEVAGSPLRVVVREPAASGGEIREVGGDAVLYELCGLGPSCSIDRGRPSEERGLLLGREAVELALYSLKYLGVDQVYVQLPPLPGDQPMRMLAFDRRDLASMLDRPLEETLAPDEPTVRNVTALPDAGLVAQLTGQHRFLFQVRSGGLDDQVLLVLDTYDPDEEARRQREVRAERAAAVQQALRGDDPSP
jgi:hypothetical protein